ncbi:MAG TPA: helix-turn-helix transcriptional regulator [Agitococcus sp.]|nr:helix-turn-helix transcriptional regulator [Agitococcus sp.]HNL37219.1 helix-turn-helix transcriptional regulator [Agitococcus sp.]
MVKTIYQESYQAFIKQLVLARKASGLTQMQVAEKLSKPQSYIAKVEGADRKLDVMEFVELCEVIHQDPSELIKLLKP